MSRRRHPRLHVPPPQHNRFERLSQPAEVAGLRVLEGQTFGVEIELTSPLGAPNQTGLEYGRPEWKSIALSIIRAIEPVATLPVDREPRNYHEVDDWERWRVEFDRSAGWEVVSPVLCNQEGIAELINVLSALNALGRKSRHLTINHRTGLHITLGSGINSDKQVHGLVKLVQVLEPGLFPLVAPSRLYEFKNGRYFQKLRNKYCRPLCESDGSLSDLTSCSKNKEESSLRYRTVNFSHLNDPNPHIEIRMHHGTTRYSEVIAWISLWMTLLNRARYRWPEKGRTGRVFPNDNMTINGDTARLEDLFTLLSRLDIHLDPRLKEILSQQRSERLESWKKIVPRRVQSWKRWWPSSAGRPPIICSYPTGGHSRRGWMRHNPSRSGFSRSSRSEPRTISRHKVHSRRHI